MFFWLFLLHIITIVIPKSKCMDAHPRKGDFYPYVSTKTGYDFVRGKIKRPDPNCEPIKLWMLMRHGTRYVGVNEIPKFLPLRQFRDDIIKNHKEGRGVLSKEKLQFLKEWKPHAYMNSKLASNLTPSGKNQAKLIGERIREAFPELVAANPDHINSSTYLFRASNSERTNESLKYFAEGFFSKANVVTPMSTVESNKVVQPNFDCDAWNFGYETRHYNDERDKFVKSQVFQKLIHAMTARFGFLRTLNFGVIYVMYSMCRYELAWDPDKASIWCILFLEEEMKILEYSEDLSYYYICGPARKLSAKLGCFPLSNMFKHFEMIENNSSQDQLKGVFYFGHTLSVQLLLMALKIDSDKNLLKATDYHLAKNRHYRTSYQAPFSTNLMAVFYKCEGKTKSNKVIFYLCERPLKIPYCHGEVCDWDDLKKIFKSDINNCSLDVCNQ